MTVDVTTEINAPIEKVWAVCTDFINSDKVISGIDKVEVLEQPASGLVGFKWKETRTMFGKTATEIMWITNAIENSHYDVRAESHGSIYESTISMTAIENGTKLSMQFSGTPVKLGAKIMMLFMGWMFKGATKKALQQDMDDIKAFIEAK